MFRKHSFYNNNTFSIHVMFVIYLLRDYIILKEAALRTRFPSKQLYSLDVDIYGATKHIFLYILQMEDHN